MFTFIITKIQKNKNWYRKSTRSPQEKLAPPLKVSEAIPCWVLPPLNEVFENFSVPHKTRGAGQHASIHSIFTLELVLLYLCHGYPLPHWIINWLKNVIKSKNHLLVNFWPIYGIILGDWVLPEVFKKQHLV